MTNLLKNYRFFPTITKMNIEVFGDTNIGKKRSNNEDSYVCYSFNNTQRPRFLIAVADGMGGHTGGEIASGLAIEGVKDYFHSQFENLTSPDRDLSKTLEDSVQQANLNIFHTASAETKLTGMGTTMVAALLTDTHTYISNVGDSRAYLIREKHIQQITIDHNWKNEQLQKGQLKEEDIQNSPYKDLITRSMGLKENLKIDSFETAIQSKDYILLSSDGLHSFLSQKEILKGFKKNKRPENICQKLIDMSNKKGGRDNITVIVAYFS